MVLTCLSPYLWAAHRTMWAILKTLQRALSGADQRTDGTNIHTEKRDKKRRISRLKQTHKQREKCVRVRLFVLVNSVRANWNRRVPPPPSGEAMPLQANCQSNSRHGAKTMIASEITVFTHQSHTHTHTHTGEVKVTAQPCLNGLPTCKATLVCQECLAVLSVSLSLLWQADGKCHDSQEKTLYAVCVCVCSLSFSRRVNAWVCCRPIHGRPNAQCLLLLSR